MTKKDAIVNAALQLLVERGVHNTPMSEIAKAAGTGMGTIYNHFANKDLLINEIYIRIKEQEEIVFFKVDRNKPIKKQFEDYITVLIEFFKNNPSYFKFLEQLEASPIITKKSKAKGGKSVELVSILLENGQREGIIKNIDIQELLMFIGGSVSAYLRWYFNKPRSKNLSNKNQIQMVWDGIKE